MKKKPSSRVSITDVARAAGISKAAAGFALQNKPQVSGATRKRVLRIARQLGYAPDPRLASWMTRVRETKSKDFLPIAWLNTHKERDVWQKYKYLSPYLEGARARCQERGYYLEQMWLYQPGMTGHHISRILAQRGIESVIVTNQARHFRFNWDRLAAVSIEQKMSAPRLHRVSTDVLFNFMLAHKMVRRFGYRRIGVCLEESIDSYLGHTISGMTHYFQSMILNKHRVPPLFYTWWGNEKNNELGMKRIVAWVRHYRPDVIIGHSNEMVKCVEAAGFRVPEDIGVVHLAHDDDVLDWAGIFSDKKVVGATAAELVISLTQNRQFGVPKKALTTLVRGSWQPGRTLLIPKPA